MKKIILLSVAFLAFSFANAQDKKDMSFGVKGGLNICSVTNADQYGSNSSSLIGFHLGLFGEFMVSDKFAIQPELLYSAQGVKVDSDGDKIDVKLDYINIPVMAKYYIAKDFSLEFGPQIGFLLSAKAKSGGVSENLKDSTKSTDFGLNFGAGYDIGDFTLGIRYNLGLSQLQKDLISGESASHNSVFQIALGYKF
ncbi:porin family protein [Flavobacterium soyangense]|uniref:PorT family protein n=1 Tax=Flavobacterium soyangense TaxID=2023265 RepID=A0A930XVI6_9FLAO|nr:porin family protein [Flavobacterium soyangense]MBF2708346.1 PorT family protein [Flavobacterium soyangense]